MTKLKSAFYFISGLFLASCLSVSALDSDDVAQPLYKRRRINTIFTPTLEVKEKGHVDNNGFVFYGKEVPEEIVLNIFIALPITELGRASQVCQGWYALCKDPQLWKAMRLAIHGDYPEHEATRENAKLHWLRVKLNTSSDSRLNIALIHKYGLNDELPFEEFRSLIFSCLYNGFIHHYALLAPEPGTQDDSPYWHDYAYKVRDIIENKSAHNDPSFVQLKIEGLKCGKYGYQLNPQAATEYTQYLIQHTRDYDPSVPFEQNLHQQIRKIGTKSYYRPNHPLLDEDQFKIRISEVFVLNEQRVSQGDPEAIRLKSRFFGNRDKEATALINEHLILQNNIRSLHRKIEELGEDEEDDENSGRDHEMAVMLNDWLADQGDHEAIEHRLEGLTHGWHGYERDLYSAHSYNKDLIRQGHQDAIERLFRGGEYGYADSRKAFECVDELIEEGHPGAINWKLICMGSGNYGYQMDIAFNEKMIKEGNIYAIINKIEGLGKIGYTANGGYQPNPLQLKKWIEEEERKGQRWAYYLKSYGLRYGILGFEKNINQAITYIRQNFIPY